MRACRLETARENVQWSAWIDRHWRGSRDVRRRAFLLMHSITEMGDSETFPNE